MRKSHLGLHGAFSAPRYNFFFFKVAQSAPPDKISFIAYPLTLIIQSHNLLIEAYIIPCVPTSAHATPGSARRVSRNYNYAHSPTSLRHLHCRVSALSLDAKRWWWKNYTLVALVRADRPTSFLSHITSWSFHFWSGVEKAPPILKRDFYRVVF